MNPKTSTKCESCGKGKLNILIDSALSRHTSFGVRGSWHYLCVACHKLYGDGFFEEKATIYFLINKKYIEQKGIYLMKIEDIQMTIDDFSSLESNMAAKSKIVLTGEIALQLAILNKNLEEHNALMRRTLIREVKEEKNEQEDEI